ncbi:MAG: glutamate--tRNA ligase [bacterium]|nr:glutamate--tRNA ligase [bacterium]
MTMRLRFAPSPTGFVHVGNARTALFNFLHARRREGKLVLRIEDTDVERSKPQYEENLIKDMKWLGIQWDEGPDSGGEFGPYRQSERTQTYRTYGQQLIDNGHAYYCFCSPEDLQKEKEEAAQRGDSAGAAGYSGKCRHLDPSESAKRVQAGEAAAIRLKIPADTEVFFYDIVRDKVSFDSNLLSDPVIIRSTGIPAYNFSVVIDDHLMGINLVIRGEDHISNTARQVLLYDAFGFDKPKFAHLSMVMGEDNTKLSKRHGSTSILQFREQGYLPEALFNYLALLGWSPGGNSDVMEKDQLMKSFNLKKVSKSAAIFDYQKLKWLNREHIRLKPDNELARLILPFLEQAGFQFEKDDKTIGWIGKAAKVLSNYNYLLPEIAGDFKQFTHFQCPEEIIDQIKTSESASTVISVLHESIKTVPSPVTFADVGEIAKKLQAEHGIKGKQLYHPIRLGLTGKESGIELKDFIPLIEEGALLGFTPPVLNMASRLGRFKS